MNVDITPIVTALIALLSTVITGFLIPLIKQKTSAENLAKLSQYAEIGVKAAEQMYRSGEIKKEDRKSYVINFLTKHGFSLDQNEINELIESLVLSLPHTLVESKDEKDE